MNKPDNKDEIALRQALPDDADDFFDLLVLSEPDYEYFFGERSAEAMKRGFRSRRNMYSHRNTIIAECGGRVAGMVLTYGHKDKAAQELPTMLMGLPYLTLDIIKKLPLMAEYGNRLGAVARGEHYISNIAVYPDFRRRGLGAALLRAAEQKALGLNDHTMALETKQTNKNAIALYKKHGYDIAKSIVITLDNNKAFYRMAKKICKHLV